jgi:Trp operon repressor
MRRRQWNQVLSESDVQIIRGLLGRGISQREIALGFGVAQQNISDIKRGKTWSKLPSVPVGEPESTR